MVWLYIFLILNHYYSRRIVVKPLTILSLWHEAVVGKLVTLLEQRIPETGNLRIHMFFIH